MENLDQKAVSKCGIYIWGKNTIEFFDSNYISKFGRRFNPQKVTEKEELAPLRKYEEGIKGVNITSSSGVIHFFKELRDYIIQTENTAVSINENEFPKDEDLTLQAIEEFSK